jgi:radical SAM superfamily enzyme YgiQ (UPF0313 family)
MTKILFSTTFKPFGIDNEFSRKDSFPECFHNRVTRAHGIFSYRGHFSAFGLHAIANNIPTQSTVLEYPTLKRFKKELKKGYDYVGIGSVVPNLQKVRVMAEAIREISPKTKIVIGGYCASIENIEKLMPIDYLCVGEGIGFMREVLGAPKDFEFKNPNVYSAAQSVMGIPLLDKKNPHIITSLGCPYGCEYCSPSHHFGAKYVRLLDTGEKIFLEMERMEKLYKTQTFAFIGDDNFLIDLKRAEGLRKRVISSGKQYEIFYFASANKIIDFGVEKLCEMGTNIVWIGRESCFVEHKKNQGIDLKSLILDLHRHGIKVVVSSMLLMDHHTPDNLLEDIDDHISLSPDFSMFTFYIALPGTPLYDRHKEEGKILKGFPYEEWNGVGRHYSHHPEFTPEEGRMYREKILNKEYHDLGPSVLRLIKTDLEGYLYLRESENPALKKRAEHIAGKMSNYKAVLWALVRLVPTSDMRAKVEDVLVNVENTFGPTTSWEKTEGLGIYAFGTKQKIRYKVFGDVIQPKTRVIKYPGKN